MFRKIIRIKAEDSPNVQLGLLQQARGEVPTNEILVPGILTYEEYQERLKTWDERARCIGLGAEFWEGKELWLFPPAWLMICADLHRKLRGKLRRAEAIGIDPAEGGDKTSMAAVDRLGVIEVESKKTPNTAVIPREALAFMRRHNVPPHKVLFDRGGGGKEHADTLRMQGYPVRTIGFGDAIVPDPKRSKTLWRERVEQREERQAYVNRRAQLFGDLSNLCDPSQHALGFAIPDDTEACVELRRQLGLIPKLHDVEGRLRMLPKRKTTKGMPDHDQSQDHDTLEGLMGCSPDESDSVVLAVHGMLYEAPKAKAGAIA